MAASESLKLAIRKYEIVNTRKVLLNLNRKTDADVIAKLESVPSMQGYIKELIRKDLGV